MPRTAQVTQFNRGKRYNRGGLQQPSIKCKKVPTTCRSICVTARAVGYPSRELSEELQLFVFRTPRSAPHFTALPRVQPKPDERNGPRGDQATENARGPRHGWKNVSIVENKRRAGLGFSIELERAPRKFGRWGAKREEERRGHSRYQPLTVHSSHRYTPRSSSLSQ